MRRILRWNYPGDAFLEIMIQGRRGLGGGAKTVKGLDEDVIAALNEIQVRQHSLSCIAANLPFGLHAYLDRPVAYFTLLREPISRCISYWYFAYRTREDGRLWSTFESYDFDLRRILNENVAFQLSNDQVRMLSGSSAAEPGESELKQARENIQEHFILAGAIEHFDRCLSLLADRFGWRRTADLKENVGDKSDRSLLPSDAVKWLRDANEWDIRLYKWLVSDYLPGKLP